MALRNLWKLGFYLGINSQINLTKSVSKRFTNGPLHVFVITNPFRPRISTYKSTQILRTSRRFRKKLKKNSKKFFVSLFPYQIVRELQNSRNPISSDRITLGYSARKKHRCPEKSGDRIVENFWHCARAQAENLHKLVRPHTTSRSFSRT